MIHYLPNHIFISGDPLGPFVSRMQEVTDPIRRRRMQEWLDKARETNKNLWSPEPKAYEQRVGVLLNAIARASVGTVLLTSLKRSIPLWIVPYQGDQRNAITGQISSELSEGVSIRFSPEHWAIGASKCARYYPGYGAVETLFHELVHASRFTNFGFGGLNKTALEKMQDAEEFLAVMMTNVLRSEWRAKKFARDYTTDELADQAGLEKFLRSKREYLVALESFLTDPFVKQVARMPMAFNPFRDLSKLKTQQGSR